MSVHDNSAFLWKQQNPDFTHLIQSLGSLNFGTVRGRVVEAAGLAIKARIPGVRIGDVCLIPHRAYDSAPLKAEVVGFKDGLAFLMPLGEMHGIGPDSEVITTGSSLNIRCGYELLGRVLDGCGQAADGKTPLELIPSLCEWPIERRAPDAYTRQPVDSIIPLGVRAIDGLLSVGRGQRIGLFAGSGVGKSVLMGQIARNNSADIVVVCLVGERGREVLDFICESLGEEGLRRAVLVVATSDMPSLVRAKSCFVATAIAEWFRDQGHNVLFMMDSATRFARAQREIGLAIGEPPARQGYPPSVFAQIPRLMERTGNNDRGSITALYTVLVQGGDMEEPIADEVRGILDGHIILDRKLAEKNHWPAIAILPSLSRVMNSIASDEHKKAAAQLRSCLALYEKNKDLILLGAYKHGTNAELDNAITMHEAIEDFLTQESTETIDFADTLNRLVSLFKH